MRAPTFIRSLSSRLSAARRSTSPVVIPLAEESLFSQQVTEEFDALRWSEYEFGSAGWLGDVLGATIATQKVAQQLLTNTSIKNYSLSNLERETIDNYLEDNVELLDACVGLVEKMDVIHNYVDSIKSAIRFWSSLGFLSRCSELERESAALDRKYGPKLLNRLMGRRRRDFIQEQDLELLQVLRISKEVAMVACHHLQRALSFKSNNKHKIMMPTVWSSVIDEDNSNKHQRRSMPWMMNELEELVMAQRLLHNQVCIDLDSLRRDCQVLEKDLKIMEESVQLLYKHLISIRVTLLGILSYS